ncbi:MAG: MoaD/ThiS family protein, partial [Acidimicrobiia bacterium]|nr:MoaD/ThiS family protein [Acidimicrobiia bacterium]
MPRSDSGGSACPCQRRSAFHVLWPCRRTRTRVPRCRSLLVTEVEGTAGTLGVVATLRLFARAREIAGVSSDSVPGATVDEVVAEAVRRYGPSFADLLPTCRVWLNGDAVPGSTVVTDKDEVAVLPPVSG